MSSAPAAAAATTATTTMVARMKQVCDFARCSHPVSKDSIFWCTQHMRMLNVGTYAIREAWHRYTSDASIWAQLEQCKTGAEMEALYAVHCYMQDEPPNQTPIGPCRVCATFSFSLIEPHGACAVCSAKEQQASK